ncbi:MAG: DUF5060 domain-containing protein [Armatimonadota bacterium]
MPTQQPPAIRTVTPLQEFVPQYGLFELSVDMAVECENPFYPEDVSLSATFRAPSGKTTVVPGFLYQAFTRRLEGNAELLTPKGPLQWRVRFSPMERGTYTYTVLVTTRSGRATAKPATFRAVAPSGHGFVHTKPSCSYLVHSDGTPYFAVGENVCWYSHRGTFDFDLYFSRFKQHSMNYARIWMSPWSVGLEWSPGKPHYGPPTDYSGLGRYSLQNAWRLDHILELARRNGIYVMLCFICHGENRVHSSDPRQAMWLYSPYALENGGPCQDPWSFFINEDAKRLFKQRLRYITARWAAYTSVLAWEFWNEVDITDRYSSPASVLWHQEMARALRTMDPYKHPITTSFANPYGDQAVWNLPEIEFTQSHYYGPNLEHTIQTVTREMLLRHRKPTLFGEFGADVHGRLDREDPDGLHLHNAIWAAAMSGSMGSAMTWWWDSYVEPIKQYHHFRALAAFVKDWPWSTHRWSEAQVSAPPTISVMGLQTQDRALLWARDANSSFDKTRQGITCTSRSDELRLRGLKPGAYRVEWWDTHKGQRIVTSEVQAADGVLSLQTPSYVGDVACKLAPAAPRVSVKR